MYYKHIDSDQIMTIFKVEPNGAVWCFVEQPANSDYQQYLAWVEEGNVAEEWNPDIIEGEA